MNKNNLPTHKECLVIIEAHHVPPHIVNHSMIVAKLAVFLAQKLKENGESVDIRHTESACLLNDIVRVCDIKELVREILINFQKYIGTAIDKLL